MEKECGFVVCRTRTGLLVRGSGACGTEDKVSIPIGCPKGSTPIALTHNHPSGSHLLSGKDKETAQRHDLAVCTKTETHGTKCYRVRRP